eukprot:m.16407 g.16407  ORF g.16407 m.16407 type:complete len:478 (-) comp4611_c0_seq1:68-1501(-)
MLDVSRPESKEGPPSRRRASTRIADCMQGSGLVFKNNLNHALQFGGKAYGGRAYPQHHQELQTKTKLNTVRFHPQESEGKHYRNGAVVFDRNQNEDEEEGEELFRRQQQEQYYQEQEGMYNSQGRLIESPVRHNRARKVINPGQNFEVSGKLRDDVLELRYPVQQTLSRPDHMMGGYVEHAYGEIKYPRVTPLERQPNLHGGYVEKHVVNEVEERSRRAHNDRYMCTPRNHFSTSNPIPKFGSTQTDKFVRRAVEGKSKSDCVPACSIKTSGMFVAAPKFSTCVRTFEDTDHLQMGTMRTKSSQCEHAGKQRDISSRPNDSLRHTGAVLVHSGYEGEVELDGGSHRRALVQEEITGNRLSPFKPRDNLRYSSVMSSSSSRSSRSSRSSSRTSSSMSSRHHSFSGSFNNSRIRNESTSHSFSNPHAKHGREVRVVSVDGRTAFPDTYRKNQGFHPRDNLSYSGAYIRNGCTERTPLKE